MTDFLLVDLSWGGGGVSRQEKPFGWVVMNLFPVRNTVGAYRIRPEVREKSAASSGDAAVGLRGSPTWRAYAIRPYTCSIEFFA